MNTHKDIAPKNLQIIHHGHPLLDKVAKPIEFPLSQQHHLLIQELMALMLHKNGVGIAAPQVGQSQQIIIVASKPNLRYPNAPSMEPLVMINPKITNASDESILDWEGCLSVPGLRGQVARSQTIDVTFYDLEGQEQRHQYNGFIARIVQHEVDHLNGKVFLDRLHSSQSILTEDQYFQQIL